ncbi:hypothetical protein BXZ70DRAFT_939653 [Cristinia sonorae]|uniref:Uncharacterized protein n=1 Tax=Cristinia sonorae TaxID=1940300 RepID=A0A8K0UND8_9AGAR|nr:hypothetical protein BXZ70DRAFT_939653 [Cristinia sonorae]
MQFSTSLVSVAIFVAGALAQGPITINTPENVVVCQPTLLTFSGGVPPYILSVLPGNQPSAQPLEQYTNLTGTSYTWNANIAAGTQVGLTLRDSTGAAGQTAPFPINAGVGDTSCLSQPSGGNASGGGTAAPPNTGSNPPATTAATTSSTGTTAPPTTTPPATTGSTTRSTTGSTTGSTTAPPAPTTTSGAGALSASLGFAGVVGAAVAAALL